MSNAYAQAGVDIAGADAFVHRLHQLTQQTLGPEVVQHNLGYAALYRPGLSNIKDPLIATTCDGVGTKLLVARAMNTYKSLGQDLVAMSVNDLLPVGARPLMFLDYIATGKLAPQVLDEIATGIVQACKDVGCALVGGETAEMPGVYPPEEFDLAGFAVGLADGARLPKPESIVEGNVVVALPSNGIHSNGLSLARHALFYQAGLDVRHEHPSLSVTLGEALLSPTRLYVRDVWPLWESIGFKAAAHITGGGLLGRTAKLAPDGLRLVIDPEKYQRPKIFSIIADSGSISDEDMARTFNMGLGFVMVVSPQQAEAMQAACPSLLRVGDVQKGSGVELGYAAC